MKTLCYKSYIREDAKFDEANITKPALSEANTVCFSREFVLYSACIYHNNIMSSIVIFIEFAKTYGAEKIINVL